MEREATQRLRAIDEMKNTFLQAVSHDLRTPLAAILGLAVTLERGGRRSCRSRRRPSDLARRIAANARRLDRLVTNLLDLDRLARGIVAPKLEPTDVGDARRRRCVDGVRTAVEHAGSASRSSPPCCRRDASQGGTHRREPPREHRPAHAGERHELGLGAPGGRRRDRSRSRTTAPGSRSAPRGDLRAVPPGARRSQPLARAWGSDSRSCAASPSSTADGHGSRSATAAGRRSACSSPAVPSRGPGRGLLGLARALPRRRPRGGRRQPGRPVRLHRAIRPRSPRRLNHSALIGVNCFHSAGTSSS